MNRIHLATTAGLCIAALIGASTWPAQAVPSKVVAKAAVASPGAAIARAKTPASVHAPASKTKPPAGYVRVASAAFTAPAGLQAAGSVSCPGKKVPLGGGVTIASDSVVANINSSYPAGKSWVADVNNGTGSNTAFTVHAICANKPKGYQVVHSATATNSAGVQSETFATCPGAKVPWSGGAFSTSGNVGVNINSSYPTGDTSHVWNVFMNNNTASDTGFVAYAVCAAKPRLYGQSFGTGTVQPSSEDNAVGTCGAGQVTTGGGDFSSSSSIFVNLNSTEPFTNTTWRTWINNNTGTASSYSAYAVCVGL